MLAARGIDVIDAPVMGGVVFAKDATLDIMVGGESAVIERSPDGSRSIEIGLQHTAIDTACCATSTSKPASQY